MDDITQRMYDAVIKAFFAFLQREFPEREFTLTGVGANKKISVTDIDKSLKQTERASNGGEVVAGHYRYSRNRGYTWVDEHIRQVAMPTALELAELEVESDLGFDLEDVIDKFISTQSNTIQNYL